MNLTVKTTLLHFCFVHLVQIYAFFFICLWPPAPFSLSLSLSPLRTMPALQSSALLLLSGLLIGLSDSLDPRDPNVCSLWERWEPSDCLVKPLELYVCFNRTHKSLRDVCLVEAQPVKLKNLFVPLFFWLRHEIQQPLFPLYGGKTVVN